MLFCDSGSSSSSSSSSDDATDSSSYSWAGAWAMDNCYLIHELNWICSFSSSAIPCIRDFFNKRVFPADNFTWYIDGSKKIAMSGQRKWGLKYARLHRKTCKFSKFSEEDSPPPSGRGGTLPSRTLHFPVTTFYFKTNWETCSAPQNFW